MKILVPTDFSECAQNAFDYAVQYAHIMNAEIILLNVYEMKYSNAGVFLDFDTHMKEFSIKELDKEKNRVLAEYDFVNKNTIETVHANGSLENVVDHFQEKGIELIVMGTRGRSGFEEVLIGSETARLIGNSEIPVLAIPQKAKFIKSNKTVFALDLKEKLKRDEIDLIKKLSQEESSLHVFHNYKDAFEIKVEEEHQLQIDFKNYFPGSLIYLDLNFDKNKLVAIENYINNVKPELIVVRSKHRNLLQSLFHKSISEKLSYHIDKPLLVLK